MNRFVDIHHHVIYGVDDGAKTREDMQDMLEKAYDDGIRAIVCTPHVTPGVQHFDWDRFDRHMEMAEQYCREHDLKLKLYKGCEILYSDMTAQYLQEERIPSMAGTDYALVEFLPTDKYERIEGAVERILDSGYRPIIAHCERYNCLVKHPALARRLREGYDLKLQVNCSTVISNKGFFMHRFVNFVFENQLIDALATDAHNVKTRPVRMKAAYKAACERWGEEYARALTNGSILED